MRRLSCLVLTAAAVVVFASPAFSQRLTQLAEVMGMQPGDRFGWAVAVSGSTLVVGAPLATSACSGQPSCGAAYIFTAPNGDWGSLTQVATLTESNGMADGGFGGALAISGSTIAVSGVDAATGEGAIYVFVEPSTGWTNMTETAELTISTSTPVGNLLNVAIDGGTVVVGAEEALSNKAYVYVEPPSGWTNMTQTAELVSSLSTGHSYLFGASVAISGRNVVVGATEAPVGGITQEGLAFLFVEPSTGWSGTIPQRTEFMASDGGAHWAFGASVSVNGNTAVVGAPGAKINSNGNQGAGYVFAKPSGGWPKTMTETVKLTAKDGKATNQLGTSVALSGGAVVSGTVKNSFEGSVDEFSKPSTGWQNASQVGEIIASDGAPNNFFGHSLAIGNGVIVVGAYGWTGGSNQGAVYVFGKAQ